MEQSDKNRRAHDAKIVAASFFSLTIFPVAAYQYVVSGAFSPLPLFLIPTATAACFGLMSYMSVGRQREYEDVTLTEMFGDLTEVDGHLSSAVDLSDDSSILLPEPVLSSVQGTPPPLLVAGSVEQERVSPFDFPIAPDVQESIEKQVAQTLANLPPLPTRLPVIHWALDTDTSSSDPLIPTATLVTPRDTLEAKPLKEVIADLGNEGYIDALLYCSTLSKAGSPDIILSARGQIRGLGARGVLQDDGTTGFTRSDVLKMLRKARGAVSANLQSDIQLSGEGRS